MKMSLKTAVSVLLAGGLLWAVLSDAADAARRSRRSQISGAGYFRSNQSQVDSADTGSVWLPYLTGVGTGLWIGSWNTNRWWRNRVTSSSNWEQSQVTSNWEQPQAMQQFACTPQQYWHVQTNSYIWGTTCSTVEELLAKVQGQQSYGVSQASYAIPGETQTYPQPSIAYSAPMPRSRGMGVFFDWLSGDS